MFPRLGSPQRAGCPLESETPSAPRARSPRCARRGCVRGSREAEPRDRRGRYCARDPRPPSDRIALRSCRLRLAGLAEAPGFSGNQERGVRYKAAADTRFAERAAPNPARARRMARGGPPKAQGAAPLRASVPPLRRPPLRENTGRPTYPEWPNKRHLARRRESCPPRGPVPPGGPEGGPKGRGSSRRPPEAAPRAGPPAGDQVGERPGWTRGDPRSGGS